MDEPQSNSRRHIDWQLIDKLTIDLIEPRRWSKIGHSISGWAGPISIYIQYTNQDNCTLAMHDCNLLKSCQTAIMFINRNKFRSLKYWVGLNWFKGQKLQILGYGSRMAPQGEYGNMIFLAYPSQDDEDASQIHRRSPWWSLVNRRGHPTWTY